MTKQVKFFTSSNLLALVCDFQNGISLFCSLKNKVMLKKPHFWTKFGINFPLYFYTKFSPKMQFFEHNFVIFKLQKSEIPFWKSQPMANTFYNVEKLAYFVKFWHFYNLKKKLPIANFGIYTVLISELSALQNCAPLLSTLLYTFKSKFLHCGEC